MESGIEVILFADSISTFKLTSILISAEKGCSTLHSPTSDIVEIPIVNLTGLSRYSVASLEPQYNPLILDILSGD